jgi:UDP-N-acetylglucosamine--N-acetylmuramyl-(pentapeptide) pyrophosphoryl-undecaprenol N-acetylglucosamine transferase
MNGLMTDVILQESRSGAPYRHIHGAGRDFETMTARMESEGISLENTGLEIRQYIYDMSLVMAAADLVICRAGAATLSELAAIRKPAILIPSPNVAADHQTKNASVLSNAGGAVLLPERDCASKPELLSGLIADLMKDETRRQAMSDALSPLSMSNSTEHIYKLLLELL